MRQVKSGKTRKWRRGMAVKKLTGAPNLRMKKFSHLKSTKPNPGITPGGKKPGDPPPKRGIRKRKT